MNEKHQKFNEILKDVLKISDTDIKDGATPDDIENWDSISHMDIISRFSEEFDIDLDVEEITKMETIGAMKEVLKDHGVDL